MIPHFSSPYYLGIEQLKVFKKEVERYESERQELANAERLFDLPITMYPELLQVQKEMKGLEQIYALYEEQTVREKTWRLLIVIYSVS